MASKLENKRLYIIPYEKDHPFFGKTPGHFFEKLSWLIFRVNLWQFEPVGP
jgi:hypothetical protein